MGVVYEAIDRELAVRVALKLLHDSGGESVERLKHEFRVAADVHHPNLVRLGELFEHGHRWCFSMELVEGVDLVSHVTGRRAPSDRDNLQTAPLTPTTGERRWLGEARTEADFHEPRLRAALAQLADGLAALHAAGVVHRDVKPSNIRVSPTGRVVLLDLGLAVAEADLASASLTAGTLEYMAPEQVGGGLVAAAADLYAVGAVLYEALVGRPPHIGSVQQVLADKLAVAPVPPGVLFGEVPPDLDRLCMALLEREPRQRPTAAAVAAQLHATDPGATPAVAAPMRTVHAFVGRTAELATLLQLGARTVRVVAGPSGIGKSALLARFAASCGERAALVCVGRCRVTEHVRLNAWEPLLEGLTRLLASLPREQRDALLPPDVEAIARLFPIFARVLPVGSTSSAPAAELERRALVALRELLRRIGERRPTVLVIDDVQWATPESLALLARLLASPAPPPVALVLGVRTGERSVRPRSGSEGDPAAGLPAAGSIDERARDQEISGSEGTGETLAAWLDAVAADGAELARVELGPLDAADARALAHQLVTDPARADALAEETGGHPLFLEVMASAATTSELLHTTLRRRVEALAPPLRQLLGVLAASGAPLRLDLLGAALGRDAFALADDLRGLQHQRLVNVTGVGRTDRAEPFHALVTDAVLAITSADMLRDDHARLADALDATPHLGPERRVLHRAWAGDTDRAVRDALAMVASARHALAHSRAADVCEVLLGLTLAGPARAALQRAYADALAGSGLAMRAAVAYRDAASAATGDDRLDLERRAAENFLRCAALDEGMSLLGRVAAALGYPATQAPGRTIAALLVERARLRLRGTRPRRGPIDPALAARSDACYSLSTGLAMIDAISGALFQTRSTRFALDAGDPARAARALATEACFVSAWGPKARARSTGILAVATALADDVADPIVAAMVLTGRGICALQWGDFPDAIRHCDAALATFRTHGAGVIWEERTGEVFAIWALAWRGDWGEVALRGDALARAGAATGDRYATMHAAVGPAVCGWLADDDPDAALARVDEVMHGWQRATLDLPLVRELVARATVGLYQGRGREVLALLDAQWPALKRSRMLGLEPLLGTLGELRMRAALLAGALDEARAWTRRLDGIHWTRGIAALGRAALAAHRGDQATALAELERAERDADTAATHLYAAAARDRRGRLLGGDAGARLIADAEASARARGIQQPARVFAALAPWPD